MYIGFYASIVAAVASSDVHVQQRKLVIQITQMSPFLHRQHACFSRRMMRLIAMQIGFGGD